MDGVFCGERRRRDSAATMSLPPDRLVHLLDPDRHPAFSGHPNPFSAVIDGFHDEVHLTAISRPAAKTHLRSSHSVPACDHVHRLPVMFVDEAGDMDAAAQLPELRMDCRVVLEDLLSKNDCLPFVELEVMDPEVVRRHLDKYTGEQTAKKMAKTGERSSQRKRKAEQQPLAVTSGSRAASKPVPVDRKRMRGNSPACRSLVLAAGQPVARPKKRTFCAYPSEKVVPSIFKRLMSQETFDELVDWFPEPEPPFESPFPTISFLEGLDFEDLVELSECSQLLDAADAARTIRQGMCTNLRDYCSLPDAPESLTDSPPPAAHSPLPPTAAASVESSEPFQSPPQHPTPASPVRSPVTVSQVIAGPAAGSLCLISSETTDQTSPTAAAAGQSLANESIPGPSGDNKKLPEEGHQNKKLSLRSSESGEVPAHEPIDMAAKSEPSTQPQPRASIESNGRELKKKKVKKKLEVPTAGSKVKAVANDDKVRPSVSSHSQPTPGSSRSQTQGTSSEGEKTKKEKRESAGVSDEKVRCPHCFMSQLRFDPHQMMKHLKFAHPDQDILPPLSPPSTSRPPH